MTPSANSAPDARGTPVAVSVKDLMSPDPRCVYPETSIPDAARVMSEARVGMLPVCDGRRVVGVVTDRDIVRRHVGALHPTHAVGAILTPLPYVISPDASIEEALELMRTHRVRRLPVCEDHELVGVLSLTDIERHVTRARPTVAGSD